MGTLGLQFNIYKNLSNLNEIRFGSINSMQKLKLIIITFK